MQEQSHTIQKAKQRRQRIPLQKNKAKNYSKVLKIKLRITQSRLKKTTRQPAYLK